MPWPPEGSMHDLRLLLGTFSDEVLRPEADKLDALMQERGAEPWSAEFALAFANIVVPLKEALDLMASLATSEAMLSGGYQTSQEMIADVLRQTREGGNGG